MGDSRGVPGTGGRSRLVRIPWMPHTHRFARIAAHGGPETTKFARLGLAAAAPPRAGPAPRRAAIPSRTHMYAMVSRAGRRSSTRRRPAGPPRTSSRDRGETLDAAWRHPRAWAGRRRPSAPRRGCGPAARTARGLRRRPERRPSAGGRRPSARLQGPAAGDRAGPGSGPARAGSAPATCTTSVGAAEPITDAASAPRRGAPDASAGRGPVARSSRGGVGEEPRGLCVTTSSKPYHHVYKKDASR